MGNEGRSLANRAGGARKEKSSLLQPSGEQSVNTFSTYDNRLIFSYNRPIFSDNRPKIHATSALVYSILSACLIICSTVSEGVSLTS